jgi:DNA-binding LytR/AlgR family response regulator
MDASVKILVVEDEMIIGAKISMQLTALGYEVTGILPRGDEALLHIAQNKPDIVLLDIQLKGSMDGIETARQIHQRHPIPIIYVTANADDATFNRAKATRPFAFISKPFKQIDLQRAVELTISQMAERDTGFLETNDGSEKPYMLSDRIFIRHKERMVKILLDEILFIEADRNYSHLFTQKRDVVLAITLKTIEEKLPVAYFQRVHRSFIINLKHIEEVAEHHVVVAQKTIPLGTGMRIQLLERLQTF